MSTTLTQTQISSLYVAIFNRASEGQGNQFWQSINYSMEDTATEMLKASDAKSYFGSSLDNNQAFIEHIYLNTLNKTVSDDSAGISFWVGLLDSGAKTRGEVVKGLLDAVVNNDFTGNTQALDAQAQFNNRVAVSNHMAETVQDTPANYAQVTGFNGDLTVTSDSATVTVANTAIDNMTQVVGDTIVISGGGAVDGTVNNDTFLASRGDIDGVVIQAKEGNDTLKATISSADDNNAALTSYDLETVMLRNTAGNTTIDLLEANGLEEVWNDRSSNGANLTLDGVSTDVTVGIKKTSTSTTVNYEDVTGASDTVNVKLDGSEEGASFVASGVENLNLDVKSDSYLDISANAGLENVVITSDSNMMIKSQGSNISITGGDGEDTLILNGALGANLELSSIEKLAVNGTTSLNLDNIDIEEVVSLNGTLTATNVEEEKFLITSDDTIAGSTAGLTATLKSSTGTDDAISVEVLNKDTTTGVNITSSLNLLNTEVLNIETNAQAGANEKVTIDLTTSTSGTANQTLNISGNAVAEFATTPVASTTIDASANTAGVELTLGVEDQTITGTAQDDMFDFGVNGDANDTVDGGAGEDMVMFKVNGVNEVSAVTSNVETASVTFATANTFDATNLTDVSLIKVNGATGTLSNILAGTNVEIDGDATALTLALKDDTGTSDALNVNLDNTGNQTVATLNANGVETLNFSVLNDDADATAITTLNANNVKAMSISSEEASFSIGTFATPDLTSIDATGFGGNLTLGALANTSSATITLGNQTVNTVNVSLTLEGAEAISDTISFGNSLIGDVVITNFKEGVSIAGDTLDFSAYGVQDVSDLDISTVGGNTIIDIASDANFGQIELIGVVHTDLVDANFDFA